MLDDVLLQHFLHEFHGYGSYEAPWWFIGMEEGGGNDEAEVIRRLLAWDKRGRLELEDVTEYHREFGVTKFWKTMPPTQPTWRQLIRLLLTAKLNQTGQVTLNQIREYQRDKWGRHGSETCLLDLLPLPSPKANAWGYNVWSNMSQLLSRDSYREWLAPKRIEIIRRQIARHRPKFVVLYGKAYFKYWQEIANIASWTDDPSGFSSPKSGSTIFAADPHPASKWSSSFWTTVGSRLA